jgi:hypothetical protein
MTGKPCKDCTAENNGAKRPAPHPGPRCTTHWRREKQRRALLASVRLVQNTYDMPPEVYDALYEAQGQRCAICRVSTGKRKRLAVDHDHSCTQGHNPDKGCSYCWRGLLCGRCNELVARFNPEQLLRAIRYIANPPARRILELAL